MSSINTLFKANRQFLYSADCLVKYFRRQEYFEAFDLAKETIDILEVLISELVSKKEYFCNAELIDISFVPQMLSGLLEAQTSNNYILLADLYEIQVVPYFVKVQEYICLREGLMWEEEQYQRNIDRMLKKYPSLCKRLRKSRPGSIEQEYVVEYTSSGMVTLAVATNTGLIYMHSNYMPLREADEIARAWFDDEQMSYSIWGLSMGYHVRSLANLSEYINIKVYESDIEVIKLACSYTDIGEVLSLPNVQLIYDSEELRLLENMISNKKNSLLAIHYPSLYRIKKSSVRGILEDFFIQNNSMNRYHHAMKQNFIENIQCTYEPVDVLKEIFQGKELYIVAAGPSLDKNFLELKKIGDNGIILSTGTVYRKLLHAGIRPDYIIGIDPTKLIFRQIQNLEKESVPMICLSTVYKDFMKVYQGKKYIAFQKGFEKAEELANEKGYILYQTGGSVSTLALDIGIRLECKKIIFLGLDLAFPEGKQHATDTAFVDRFDSDTMLQVLDMNGKQIPTGKNLNIYRKWIEKRISGIKDIEFIDATEGGAKIKGMKVGKLAEIIAGNLNKE